MPGQASMVPDRAAMYSMNSIPCSTRYGELHSFRQLGQPLIVTGHRVPDGWCDWNGHVGFPYAGLLFDDALDTFCDIMDLGYDHLQKTGQTFFVIESSFAFHSELLPRTELRFEMLFLAISRVRLHYIMSAVNIATNDLSFTCEQVVGFIDANSRRVVAIPQPQRGELEQMIDSQASLARPPRCGRLAAAFSRRA